MTRRAFSQVNSVMMLKITLFYYRITVYGQLNFQITALLVLRRFPIILKNLSKTIPELYGPKLGDPELLKRFQKLGQIIEDQHATMKKQLEISGVIQGILAAKHSVSRDTSSDEIFAQSVNVGCCIFLCILNNLFVL